MPWNEKECATRGEKVKQLETRTDKHEEEFKEVREDIRRIQNRPPIWVIWVFSAGSFLLGSSLTIIVVLYQIVNDGKI